MRRFTLVHGTLLGLGATCGLLLAATGAGCGGDDIDPDGMGNGLNCSADKVTGSSNKFASDALKLPKTSGTSTYAYDFDGNGKQENQLKNLVSVISLAGLNIQESIDKAVTSGQAILLADIKTPDLMTSSCSSLTFNLAESPAMGAPPLKFDGTDTFAVSKIMGATLYGNVVGGKLSTIPSKDQTAATEQRITLNLPIGSGTVLPLSLRGAHIEGTLVMENGILKIQNGAIHGVLAKKDIDEKIVPIVADLLTTLIHGDIVPGMMGMPSTPGQTAKAIIGLFEVPTDTKCTTNPKDCCATNLDTCKITKEEVAASSIGNILSPDVQVLDETGVSWKPVAGGKAFNAMSVGIGFSSVKANF